MARVVVLGGGIAGHTAALHLTRMLKRSDEVVVVTPNSNWNWIPSNIWVGVGKMKTDQVTFELGPMYKRKGIEFHQALATAIHPEGGPGRPGPYVEVTSTDPARAGQHAELDYDYLVNATGPKLNFGATPGLGPDGHSYSVCTAGHAVGAAAALQGSIRRMKNGERQVLVVGMGHGTCTCEGAAFEYTFNVEHEVRRAGVRDLADIVFLTNEYELGDFGVGGLTFTQQGFPDDVQAVDRVALPGARDPGHHRGPRHERRAGRRPLRAAGRFGELAVLRLRHAAPAVPRGGSQSV